MNKSFDEWLDTTKLRGYMDENSLEAAYEAGQQSKQAEIDELHIANVNLMRIKEKFIERNEDMFKQILKRENCNRQLKSEVDELQKRIDEALHEADESCGVSVDAFVKLNKILKGNTNEH